MREREECRREKGEYDERELQYRDMEYLKRQRQEGNIGEGKKDGMTDLSSKSCLF